MIKSGTLYAIAVAIILTIYMALRYAEGCGPDAVRIGGVVVASCKR